MNFLGKKSRDIIKRDHKVISKSLTRDLNLVFDKAKDSYIYDVDGKKYLDFAAGIAVINVGYSNKEVTKSIISQVKKSTHCAFSDFYAELPVRFSEELLKFLPRHLNNVFLSNSGTEAVEAAYKLARWHSNKKWCIAFKNSFHGRTMGSLSLTMSKLVHKDRFYPFLPVKHVPYAYPYRQGEDCSNKCLKILEKTMRKLKKDLAAVFIEPIQGEGGYIVPPKEFVKGVRELCNRYNVLLCDDEVQAGCYRTGKFLAIENFNVKPDVVILSKAIGGGMPLGATIANKKIMDWPPGSHANTFGGNLASCASGLATLELLKKKKLGDNAKKIGDYMLKRLNKIKEDYEIVGDVRGIGLMIGMELVKNKKGKKYGIKEREKVLKETLRRGLVLLPAGKSTIRICPPLIINKKQANKGLNIIEDSIKEVSK